MKQFLLHTAKKIVTRILNQIEDDKLRAVKKNAHIAENTRIAKTARIVNRQQNPALIQIGHHSVLRGELMIMGYGGKIDIGSYTYIGEHTRIWSGQEIAIGHHVLISHNVNIMDTNSHQIDHTERAAAFKDLLMNGPATVNKNITCKPVTIENHAWINFNSTILKGVTIGEGAIIGPNSVVLEDIPPYSVYAGNPATFIKKVGPS